MAKITFDKKFRDALKEYAERYDVESLDSPNDIANLHTMIRNQIVVEEMQNKMHELAEADAVVNVMEIQKLNIALRDIIDRNLALERALAIDRKTRKNETQQSVVDYIAALKSHARLFLDKQLIRVRCPKCKILVGRISPVHEHTAFSVKFQCSQCFRWIIADRAERDVFFDIKDVEWRKQYPVQISHPKTKGDKLTTLDSVENDLIIGDDREEEEEYGTEAEI